MTKIHIVHLYPSEMNIYGDTGNRLILEKRLEWRGYQPVVQMVGVGQKIPKQADIILGGGGQDSGQMLVVDDLQTKKTDLQAMHKDGVVMLMICGMYQLFGNYFQTSEGDKLKGIGIFDLVTAAGDKRLIGNIKTQTPFGQLVGYENHSGLTTLGKDQNWLGKCDKYRGNNGKDQTEGAISGNVFGSYLHGPMLSKNPHFADELIRRALERKLGKSIPELSPLNDIFELQAAKIAARRPR